MVPRGTRWFCVCCIVCEGGRQSWVLSQWEGGGGACGPGGVVELRLQEGGQRVMSARGA